ncbi:MAG: PaaI family thioesterase [Lachnospiraceae bacterium]|nr:PaaI family thioesterase [Lachnospiraceae bacterium]
MGFEKGWNPFMEYNNIEVVSVSTEKSVLKAEISENSLNPYGMIHGGLLYTMIDCTAGITARADGNPYVTQNSYVNFLYNVKDEKVIYAESDVIRRGKTVVVVHVRVYTTDGKDLADAVVDMFRVNG